MNEAALAEAIRGAQQGDATSFDCLVDAYAPRLFGFLFRLTGSRQESEDLLQEVYLRLVRMIEAYTHEGRFDAWLFRIAANLVRDRVRKVRRTGKFVSGVGDAGDDGNGSLIESIEASEPEVERGLVMSEEMDALNRALAELPEAEREVIVLRHFSQMSFKEIAEATDVPLGTALARGHRGLEKLRKLMAPETSDEMRNMRQERTAARG
ncbi:MAG: sigma-70 family RNA polymerase sigma factor [Phycisphaerales bacterium]|nr:sigma-70 family RNA polymerase sigma factor [Phycisphaerales bacterium]MCB9862718.1 sigma-70 family RNA polymerase sigma factor [Phycisphaerales bacterium]